MFVRFVFFKRREKMKEELDSSLRLTGAKAISELRKLERRNSLDLEVSEAKAAGLERET